MLARAHGQHDGRFSVRADVRADGLMSANGPQCYRGRLNRH